MSLSLDNQNIRGKQLDKDQYETVERLYEYSLSLNKSLRSFRMTGDGKTEWGSWRIKRGFFSQNKALV